MPQSLQIPKECKLLLGIRPEHMELITAKNKKGLVGKIQHRENLGSDVFLHLILNGGEEKIIVRSDPNKALDTIIGDEVKIGWQDDHVLAFERDGQNIAII